MSRKKIIQIGVGVDMASSKFDCNITVIREGETGASILSSRVFENTVKGFKEFLSWFKKLCPVKVPYTIVVEATGVYHEEFVYFVHESGFEIVVELPNKTKNYRKSLNQKSKTDKLDAKTLAQYALERKGLRLWVPPSPELRSLREITRELETLKQQRTRINNQLHAKEASKSPYSLVLDSKIKQLTQINELITNLEKGLKSFVNKYPKIKKDIDLMCTIPGIAFITACINYAETSGYALFNSKSQLVSFSGLDIVLNDSGKYKGKSTISKKGNSHIRSSVFCPAWTAVKYNIPLQKLFNRIQERNGNMSSKSYVAIHRKLIVLMYTVCKTGKPFDPNYEENNRQEKLENKKGYAEGLPLHTVHLA